MISFPDQPARLTPDDFGELFRANHGLVVSYVARLVGPAAAADVAQDVFAELWGSSTEIDVSRGGARALLLTIAHRRAIDAVRSSHRRSRREERHGDLSQLQQPTDFELVREESAARVVRALLQLPPLLREPIELAVYGDHTYREVAVRLGVPEGTVKSRIRLGLRQLRGLLADRADTSR